MDREPKAPWWIVGFAVLGVGCVDLTPPWHGVTGVVTDPDAATVVPPPGGGGSRFDDGPATGARPGLDAAQADPVPGGLDGGYRTLDSFAGPDITGSDVSASEAGIEVGRPVDGAEGERDAHVLPVEPDAPLSGLDEDCADQDSRDGRNAVGDVGGAVDRHGGAIDTAGIDATPGFGGAGGAGTGATGAGGAGGTTGGASGTMTGSGGLGAGAVDGSPSSDADVGDAPDLPPDANTRLSQGLVAYYPCEPALGSVLPDFSGHAADGTLLSGTSGGEGFAYDVGRIGQAVYFSAKNQGYATLPSTLLAGAQEVTVATWVYLNNAVAWQRIFDFGKKPESDGPPKVYMYLAAGDGTNGFLHFAISATGPGSSEQSMEGPVLSTRTWHHVAVVLGPTGGLLYVDGARVGANSAMSLRPADLPHPLDYYIGLSQWPMYQVNLDADIDEFRVYDRALEPEEIQVLAAGL